MIYPFFERTREHGLTYGLSPAGYDIRIDRDLIMERGDFTLAGSLEHFNMPLDLIAYVKDKSTLARMGLDVKNTVIEPGWRGHLTLELTNNHNPAKHHGTETIILKRGQAIAQIIWHTLTTPTEQGYEGKYQDQEAGAQVARFDKDSKP